MSNKDYAGNQSFTIFLTDLWYFSMRFLCNWHEIGPKCFKPLVRFEMRPKWTLASSSYNRASSDGVASFVYADMF